MSDPAYFTGMLVNDETGEIYPQVYKVAFVDVGKQKWGDAPEYMLEGEWDSERLYCPDGGMPIARPCLFDDEYTAVANATDEVDIVVPEGSSVLLDYRAVAVSDGKLVITSSLKASYVFDIAPPFPAQRQTIKVTFS